MHPLKLSFNSYWSCCTKLECQAVVQPSYLKQITCFAIKILNILPPAFSSGQNSLGVLWSFVMGMVVNLDVWLIPSLSLLAWCVDALKCWFAVLGCYYILGFKEMKALT